MRKKQGSIGRLGLVLACSTLTFALSTQAGKPVKPPSAPAFTAVSLGGLLPSDSLTIFNSPADINNAGQVVGQTCIPGFNHNYMQPYILNPKDNNADGKPDTWFVHAVRNPTSLPVLARPRHQLHWHNRLHRRDGPGVLLRPKAMRLS